MAMRTASGPHWQSAHQCALALRELWISAPAAGLSAGPRWGTAGLSAGPRWGTAGLSAGPRWGTAGLPAGPRWGTAGLPAGPRWNSAAVPHLCPRGYRARATVRSTKAAYDLCHRFTSAQNSRHIDRRMFKMRELRGAGFVTVAHVGTEHNPADLFTKILSRQPFEIHRKTVPNLPGDTGVE